MPRAFSLVGSCVVPREERVALLRGIAVFTGTAFVARWAEEEEALLSLLNLAL